jgi:hypothetical protein
MLTYEPRHEIDCTPKRFWELYFDPAFQDSLFLDGLGWSKPEIIRFEDGDKELLRDIKAFPKLELPGPLAKLIKEALGYTERARFDKDKEVFHMKHRTNIFGDKVHLGGRFWVEAVGEHRCRRRGHVEVEAKVFGVGKLLEKAVEINMKKGWDQSATFYNRWVAKHPEE